MSRGSWAVQIPSENSSGWEDDGTIFPPNDNLSLVLQSTQIKVGLADGSSGWICPETVYLPSSLRFIWYYDDGTTKAKIEAYIKANQVIKIIDHNDIEYVGKFIQCDALQKVGESPDVYDLQVIFERMPSLE